MCVIFFFLLFLCNLHQYYFHTFFFCRLFATKSFSSPCFCLLRMVQTVLHNFVVLISELKIFLPCVDCDGQQYVTSMSSSYRPMFAAHPMTVLEHPWTKRRKKLPPQKIFPIFCLYVLAKLLCIFLVSLAKIQPCSFKIAVQFFFCLLLISKKLSQNYNMLFLLVHSMQICELIFLFLVFFSVIVC